MAAIGVGLALEISKNVQSWLVHCIPNTLLPYVSQTNTKRWHKACCYDHYIYGEARCMVFVVFCSSILTLSWGVWLALKPDVTIAGDKVLGRAADTARHKSPSIAVIADVGGQRSPGGLGTLMATVTGIWVCWGTYMSLMWIFGFVL